jgi:hypothetical protein
MQAPESSFIPFGRSTHWATSSFSKKVTAKEIEVLRPSSMLELLILTPGLGIMGGQVYISRYFDNNSSNVPVPHIIIDGVETLGVLLTCL